MRCSIAVGTVCFLAYVELVVKDVDTLGILVVGCAVCNVDVAEELACWSVVDDKTASLGKSRNRGYHVRTRCVLVGDFNAPCQFAFRELLVCDNR